MLRREFLAGSGALAAAIVAGRTTAAPVWPSRAVRFVYPYAAGSAGDVGARLLSQRLVEALHQQFVVENHVGANGALAAERVARAEPDGYTFFYATLPQIAILPAMNKVPYDPVRDFVPVSVAVNTHFALVVHPSLPVRTVREFVDYVRARPGQLAYAQGGTGSTSQLSMAMFLHRAGLRMIDVGYKGNAPAINDVIAGHVPAMSSLFGDAWQQAKSGAIRMLAVTSEQRLPQAPDVPTLAESGFPGFQAAAWHGLLAPARTPTAIVDRLSAEVVRIVGDKKFRERLLEAGLEPVVNTPGEFVRMIAADLPLWSDTVRAAGLRS